MPFDGSVSVNLSDLSIEQAMLEARAHWLSRQRVFNKYARIGMTNGMREGGELC